jgi:hypothetical protein
MKKILVSSLLALQVLLSLSPLVLASSGGSGTGSSNGTSTSSSGETSASTAGGQTAGTPGSEALDNRRYPSGCREILANDNFVNTDDSASNLATGANEPIVLLTEGITRGSNSASCGQAIYCMREFYGYQLNEDGAVTRVTQNIIDILTLSHLKNHSRYEGCYVSGSNGLDLLNNYAKMVYRWIASIVGSVCVLIIIFSGIQISLGGVSPDEVQGAKDRVVRSLIGLAVLFLSALILYTINPLFFA